MTPSNHESPAGGSLRRNSKSTAAIRIGCAAAVAFGALNLIGALATNSYGVLELLALITVVAGAAGIAGSRAGVAWTLATMAIYLVSLIAIGLAVSSGQAVSFTAPDWLVVDYRVVLLFAAAWCTACLVALFFGMRWRHWEGSSGTK